MNWIKRHDIALCLAGIVIIVCIVIAVAINKDDVAVNSGYSGNTGQISGSNAGTKAVQTPVPAVTPKTKTYGDGTYEVGKDILVGVYTATGENCYWHISSDSNGARIIQNNFGSGQQIVTLDNAGTFFKVQGCPFTIRA